MEFFNKKEEVLEVILTQKGKELFSKGLFKPYYYSFHDNDIIYDNNSNELQNQTVPRIKETPTLKQNTSVYQNPSNVVGSLKSKQTLYSEIGGKTLGDQYRPSWNLDFIKSPPFQYVGTNPANPTDNKKFQVKFTSSLDVYNQNQEVIPQIDIQTNYSINLVTFNPDEKKPIGSKENPFKNINDYQASKTGVGSYYIDNKGNLIEVSVDPKTGKIFGKNLDKFVPKLITEYYFVKDQPIILDVSEYNSFENFEKQEFEVDAFYFENGQFKDLTFNKDLTNAIFQYLNILFDSEASFDIKINTKDIYGELIEKDQSNC